MNRNLLFVVMLTAVATAAPAAPLFEPANSFLSIEQAFPISSIRHGQDITVSWTNSSGYYLYRDKIVLRTKGLTFPAAAADVSPTPAFRADLEAGFQYLLHGRVVVTWRNVGHSPAAVTFQGCAERGLCYPPRTVEIP